MNREDIIRMAREAGLVDNDFEPSEWCVHEYMAFAALVASAEREACADTVDKVATERNASKEQRLALHVAADAIRARGDKHD